MIYNLTIRNKKLEVWIIEKTEKIIHRNNIKLSSNEINIHDFINNETEKFIQYSIKEISESMYVSIGSITRYVKKMGFKTFKELKIFVIKENERQIKYYSNNNSNFLENVNIFYLHSIEKTMNALNPQNLEQAYLTLKKSKKIICYGIGSSLNVAQEMAYNLHLINKETILAVNIHDIILNIKEKEKNDYTIIIFSKSMRTKENKFILDLLKKYNIKVILITNNLNYATQNNLIVIHFYTLEQEKRVIALSSKISQLFISDILLRKLYLNSNIHKSKIYNEFNDKWK